jgi:pimeloyl-ACP methyl ester carboxylesterase
MTSASIRTSDGVELHLVDEGAGPAVVLLAGYGAPAKSWTLQVEALRHDYRVIALDRRQHGRSDRPPHGQRMSRHAADVHEVLDALSLDDALLVGSSMGANVALTYVDTFGCDRLRGLVLVDQTPKMINDGDWQLGFYGLTWQNADTWVRSFPEGVQAFHTVPDDDLLAMTQDGPAFSIDDSRALLRDHCYADWRDVLPRTTVPVTAMAGRHSPVWPWESSAWLADAAPQGELVVFEHSGHVPMLEEPDAFNAALLRAARG